LNCPLSIGKVVSAVEDAVVVDPFATSMLISSDFWTLLAGSVNNRPLVPESRYLGLGICIIGSLFTVLHNK
jgi:hypothetical protein